MERSGRERYLGSEPRRESAVIRDIAELRVAIMHILEREEKFGDYVRESEDQKRFEDLDENNLWSRYLDIYILAPRERDRARALKSAPENRLVLASGSFAKREVVADTAKNAGLVLAENFYPYGTDEFHYSYDVADIAEQGEERFKDTESTQRIGSRFYAIEAAHAKLDALKQAREKAEQLKVAQGFALPAPDILVGLDIVAICKGEVLHKPGSREHALALLKQLSGQKTTVSLGIAINAPSSSGKLYSYTQGVFIEIALRSYSEQEAEDYINSRGDKALSVAGAIDYGDISAQALVAEMPVEMSLVYQPKGASSLKLSAELLPQMRDYFSGIPREILAHMLEDIKTSTAHSQKSS